MIINPIETNAFDDLDKVFTVCVYCHENDWCVAVDGKEICKRCYSNTNESTTNVLQDILCSLENYNKKDFRYVALKIIRDEIIKRRVHNAD